MSNLGYTYEFTCAPLSTNNDSLLMAESRNDQYGNIQNTLIELKYLSNDRAQVVFNFNNILSPSKSSEYSIIIELYQLAYINYTVYIDKNNNKELIIFRYGQLESKEYDVEYTIFKDYDNWETQSFVSSDGIPITNVRVYRMPLSPSEVFRHFSDAHSWGVNYPIEEQYLSRDIPNNGAVDYKEDIFDGDFSDNTWEPSARSRKRRILKSSYDSFGLRDKTEMSEYSWYNTVTSDFIELDNKIYNYSANFEILDPKWDEASNTDKVIADLNNVLYDKDDVNLNISDWRFGIEYSPTSALDWDQLRGMSNMRNIDNWVGAPENLWSDSYVDLEEYRKMYFNRKIGAFEYLHLMKLHRWLFSNLRNTIDKLIPYNVAYMGFNNVIEPHATERCKVKYSGSDRFLDVQNRLSPSSLILSIIDAQMNRF